MSGFHPDRRRWLFLLAAIHITLQFAVGAGAVTMEVSSAEGLLEALQNETVTEVAIVNALALRTYNGWSAERPITISRSIKITGKPAAGSPASHMRVDLGGVLPNGTDINFLKSDGSNVSITFYSLHFTGLPVITITPDKDLLSISFFLENCIIEPWNLDMEPDPNWLAWIRNPRVPYLLAPGKDPNRQLIKPATKEFCNGWLQIECPLGSYVYLEDMAFYLGASNASATEAMGLKVEETGILRVLESMLIVINVIEVIANNTADFQQALMESRGHRTVIFVEGILSIEPFEIECPIVLPHSVSIIGRSTSTSPPLDVLDLHLRLNCTLIPPGSSVAVQNLMLNNTAIKAPATEEQFPYQKLMPFFIPMKGSKLELDNVAWTVQYPPNFPLSTGSLLGDLIERSEGKEFIDKVTGDYEQPAARPVDDEYCNLEYIGESQACIESTPCRELNRCPEKGVFANYLSYNYPAEDDAQYTIRHSLLVPRLVKDPFAQGGLTMTGNGTGGTDTEKKTPRALIIILVVLGVIGLVIGVAALILFKLRARSRARAKLGESMKNGDVEYGGYDEGVSARPGGSVKSYYVPNREHKSTGGSEESFAISAQQAAERMFGDITLGDLLGQGAFGRVYRGAWNGAVVAIKIMLHSPTLPNQEDQISREINFLLQLRHPNIVNLYQAATRVLSSKDTSKESEHSGEATGEASGVLTDSSATSFESLNNTNPNPPAESRVHKETWMLMEFCDRGTLSEAFKEGAFFQDPVNRTGINLEYVLLTCQDVARGLRYLHDNQMIHGDLKPHNVLMATSPQDSRKWVAKIADFGVSRQLSGSHIYTGTVGTMMYMPPELLGDSKLSNKTDVYAFGLIMWQMITGTTPFGKVSPADLWRKVVMENFRPEFPENTPRPYMDLAMRCWDTDPQIRPPFDEIQGELTRILKGLKGT